MTRYRSIDDLPEKFRPQAIEQLKPKPRPALPRPIHLQLLTELVSLNNVKQWRARQRATLALKAEVFGRYPFATFQPPTGRQRVTITRVLGPRQRAWDVDNLAGGTAKGLIDALTELGMWRDDNPAHLEREYEQDDTRREQRFRVEVLIEDLEER